MTKISVLLPVYNTDPAHLKGAIGSVLAQSFRDFELLIYNDASTAAQVEETVLSFNDPRINYIRSEENCGIAKVRNKLIDLARGEYLAVMDHDDLCLPERFARQVAHMDAHPETGVCGTAHRRFGSMFKNSTIRYPDHDADIRAALFFKNVIHHPSAMIRKDVLDRHRISYDETLVSANDRKLFMDIAGVAKLCNLNEVLCLYRLHAGMTSKKKRAVIVEEQKKLRLDFLARMGVTLTPEEFSILNDIVMNGRARIRDAETQAAAEKVLSLLSATNAKSGFIPAAAFDRQCAQYLIKRCQNAAIYGRVGSRRLLSETRLPVGKVRQPLWFQLVNCCKG